MPITFPMINRNAYDWSSVKIMVGGVPYLGIREISYRSEMEPGEVYGTSSQLLGRTPGQLKHSGSFSMYRAEFGTLTEALSALARGPTGGFMQVAFPIIVSYQEDIGLGASTPMNSDVLEGCRIKSAENSHSAGNEPLVVRCDLSIMRISHDKVNALRNALGG